MKRHSRAAIALHGHAPFGRFFLKKELIWVPIVGVVCWAMDFPFMKRHSRAAIARGGNRPIRTGLGQAG